MLILYINLEKRKTRNQNFLEVNSGVADFRRVDAVDGKSLRGEDLLREAAIHEPLKAYTPGALGCALSHKRIWEFCIANSTSVTVAEDDAVFNRHFAARAAAAQAKLPPDWDLMLWGWNFDSLLHVEVIEGVNQSVMHFDPRQLGQRVPAFQDKDYEVLPLRLLGAFGTVCYSVSAKGAQLLNRMCFPLKNETFLVPGLKRTILNFNIDSIMNKYYGVLKAYVSFPPLVWTENDKATSDVSLESHAALA